MRMRGRLHGGSCASRHGRIKQRKPTVVLEPSGQAGKRRQQLKPSNSQTIAVAIRWNNVKNFTGDVAIKLETSRLSA